MTRSVSVVLATALALAGVIAWECSGGFAASDPPLLFRPPEVARSLPEAREALRDRAQAQAAAVLARPLFSPTRRPSPAATAGAGPGEPTLPRLAGVLVSQAGRQAIFAPAAAGGKAVAAGEGGRIGAFVVSAIAVGEVTVLGPDGGARVLRPKADPAVRTAAAPAMPATPTAGAAQAAPPPILDLLRDISSEGAKPGATRPGAAR